MPAAEGAAAEEDVVGLRRGEEGLDDFVADAFVSPSDESDFR